MLVSAIKHKAGESHDTLWPRSNGTRASCTRRSVSLSPTWRGLPEHLSVYQRSPELWEREAFEEKLDGAPEATGEPGKSSAGELGRLAVRVFFSAGAGLLAWSHMPVETAQYRARAMTNIRRERRSG